jgi:hypothetical protein
MQCEIMDFGACNIMVKKKRRKKSGYLQRFRHNIDLNSFGVDGDLIEWCKRQSEGSWGWWFWTHPDWHNLDYDTYDERAYGRNRAYMSFQYKKDALRFWFWWQRMGDHANKR